MRTIFTSVSILLTFFSSAQITKVKSICPGSDGGHPKSFIEFDNKLFFDAGCTFSTNIGHELYITDGTEANTLLFKDINPNGDAYPEQLTVINNKMYFVCDDGTHGVELWVTDGTSQGTNLVKDINPNGDAYPYGMIEINGTVLFAANDGSNGIALWTTDGTTSGTNMLLDINPNNSTVGPTYFYKIDDHVYFGADDGVHGLELWKSDGTAAGTSMVKDINPTGDGIPFPTFFVFNDELYFNGYDNTNNSELWKTDGTNSGTVLVENISPNGDSNPRNFCAFNNELYFVANHELYGRELWKTDGTSSGTSMVKNIAPGTEGSYPQELTVYNGKLYFQADNFEQHQINYELWESDGTASGTFLSYDFSDVTYGGKPNALTVYENRLILSATDSSGNNNMYIKNANASPYKISWSGSSTGGTSVTNEFYEYDNALFFKANYENGEGYELWKYTPSLSALEETKLNVNVYPNPATNTIYVNGVNEQFEVTIFNVMGQNVIKEESTSNSIDISGLKTGIYILQLVIDENTFETKFVKN